MLLSRCFRFKLRTALVMVFVASLPLAWILHEAQLVRARRNMLDRLDLDAGFVDNWLGREPQQLGWLRRMLEDVDVAAITVPSRMAAEQADIARLFPEAEIGLLPADDSPAP